MEWLGDGIDAVPKECPPHRKVDVDSGFARLLQLGSTRRRGPRRLPPTWLRDDQPMGLARGTLAGGKPRKTIRLPSLHGTLLPPGRWPATDSEVERLFVVAAPSHNSLRSDLWSAGGGGSPWLRTDVGTSSRWGHRGDLRPCLSASRRHPIGEQGHATYPTWRGRPGGAFGCGSRV